MESRLTSFLGGLGTGVSRVIKCRRSSDENPLPKPKGETDEPT